MLLDVSQRATKAHEDQIKEKLFSTVSEMEENLAGQLKDSYV